MVNDDGMTYVLGLSAVLGTNRGLMVPDKGHVRPMKCTHRQKGNIMGIRKRHSANAKKDKQ